MSSNASKPVKALKHDDKRLNIPTADSEDLLSEAAARVEQVRYPRNRDLDPQLVWNGKDEQDAEDLVVDAPPIYIQEKIDPRAIIQNLRRRKEAMDGDPQAALFDVYNDFDGIDDPLEAVDYYQHEANWSNRMILGDSLQVMGSLAEKEKLRGKVQMIYIDPPYGISFASNWQVSTGNTRVADGKATDTTREVEQIKAFRDTWEKGIHSYLAYLRDRLMVAYDLLNESGSLFVQIGDENVHLVRSLLDKVFGNENFVSLITFKTTSGAGSFAGGTNVLAAVNSYIVWYAKDLPSIKYRQLFRSKEVGGQGSGQYTWAEKSNGECIRIGKRPLEVGERLMRPDQLTSQTTRVGKTTVFPVEVGGKSYLPSKGGWKTNQTGMRRLGWARRLLPIGKTLTYVRFLDDFPAFPYNNLWEDTVTSGYGDPKIYVVQTNTKIVERCMLMTTDPGDLVIDPTCGSGTTAYVAEQWGRRWITVDTSRVALALARQRIMGAKFPYYLLADTREGQLKEQELTGKAPLNGETHGDVRKGFVYQRVPHITLKSIANNLDIREGMSREEIDAAIKRHADSELLYDKPYEDKKKIRVAGRFTVESLSPHKTIVPERTRSEEAAKQDDPSAFERTILENLFKAGVQNGRRRERLEFASPLQPYAGQRIQAFGVRKNGEEGTPQSIGVSIGPQFGTVDGDWIRRAAREATRGQGFDMLLICAFAFDSQAVKATEEFAPSNPGDFATVQRELELGRIPILLVRMNSDLAMGDVLLKKTGSGNLFMVFGEPDVDIRRTDEGLLVEIKGVDVYDPTTGVVRSSGPSEIALWMIDTDYNDESFFVRHCYFTGDNKPYLRLQRALKAEIDEEAWSSLYSTVSVPFPVPADRRIAVKVINHYGDEVLKVYDV
ncbi:DNA methylase N-4/N-6 [Mycobacterium tuberculosis]|nr:DNA methylase N-4/N-6 [Mycobacterium tuberculosis]